jgi:DNA adenine methylase Dam
VGEPVENEMSRVICWFSAGVTSAVAAKLAIEKFSGHEVVVAYCDTGSEHPDNERFLSDCEKWLGTKIEKIKSEKYKDIWDVYEKTKWLVGPAGARCTTELKKVPRNHFQRPDDIHVFGFDAKETGRIKKFRRNNPEITLDTPLADHDITKDDCLKVLVSEGIEIPVMYQLGFRNNNCIPCPKGGMGYFNHIRKHFPAEFDRMAKVERKLGVAICSKQENGVKRRIYLDELDPFSGNYKAEPGISCGISCGVQEMPLQAAEAKPFLRWAGGKSKFVPSIAPYILEYLQESGGRYIEPFLGGGAMALHLGFPHMVLGDVIEDLTAAYMSLRDTPTELAKMVYQLGQWGSGESHYYAVRSTEPDTMVERGARMIYLNAHCFNGLWRMNKSGEMNVPYGKKKDRITDSLIERLGFASEALAGSRISTGDFEPLLRGAREGDLVYVDPPYDDTFSSYSGEAFGKVSQERLAASLYDAHRRGAAFIAHNSDTEKVRWWYNEFATLLPTGESRSVNSDGQGRDKAPCLLITNRPKLLSHAAVAA